MIEVTATQALQAVKLGMRIKKPVLLVGAPGVGKSSIFEQAAAEEGWDVLLSHPVVEEPTDAKGMPWIDPEAGVARFFPFDILHKAMTATKPTLWVLDDLGQANEQVQAAYMQLLLAREVAGKRISDFVTFAAATNRRGDKSGVRGILEAVKSRFAMILQLKVSHPEWEAWAYRNEIHPLVIQFLQFRPELLHVFEPSFEIQNYPSPRTWERVSDILKGMLPEEAHLLMLLIAGSVGDAAGTEFAEFVKIYSEIPMPEKVLLLPEKAVVPKRLSVQYALAAALVSMVTEATFPALVKYAERMIAEANAMEVAVTMIKSACRVHSDLTGTPAYAAMLLGPLGPSMA